MSEFVVSFALKHFCTKIFISSNIHIMIYNSDAQTGVNYLDDVKSKFLDAILGVRDAVNLQSNGVKSKFLDVILGVRDGAGLLKHVLKKTFSEICFTIPTIVK